MSAVCYGLLDYATAVQQKQINAQANGVSGAALIGWVHTWLIVSSLSVTLERSQHAAGLRRHPVVVCFVHCWSCAADFTFICTQTTRNCDWSPPTVCSRPICRSDMQSQAQLNSENTEFKSAMI